MQQKAAHELVGLQRHGLQAHPVLGPVILPAEADAAVIHREEPVVGDRYPVGILSQVFHNLLRITQRRFAVYHPWLFPQTIKQRLVLRQLMAFAELAFDLFEHFAPEHRAEHSLRIKVFALFGNVFQLSL